jgi:hypothetical protein
MRLPVMLAALALAAACSPQSAAGKSDSAAPNPAAAPAGPADPTGFTHPAGADLFGYYTTTAELKAGDWQLNNFHIGDEDAFKAWESGDRTATYAPVMLEFDNMTSPMQTNELGAQFHTVSERILPTAYAIAPDGKIDFAGTGVRLGKVTFHGRLDMAGLKAITDASNSANPPEGFQGEATVMTGTLTVGDKRFENVAFTWFGGD